MYRPSALAAGLLHTVGFRQHENTAEYSIASSLLASESGMYFQQFHPLLTLDNMKAAAPKFEDFDFNAFNELSQYYVSDTVSYQGNNYRALLDSLGKTPDINPTYWERWDPFSDWLERQVVDCINGVAQDLWLNKLSNQTAKNILENKVFFNGAGRMADTIANNADRVGFEIVPIRSYGILTRISKIGLQFTALGTVTVYLMHSSKLLPVDSFQLEITKVGSINWFDVDIELPYISDDTDAGGSWFLVYNQSELPEGAKAINRNIDFSKKPCYECNTTEYNNKMQISRYLEAYPFSVSEDTELGSDFNDDFNDDFGSEAVTLWDISKNKYSPTLNYGMNIAITVECDTTDVLISQRASLANIIGLRFAIDMLRRFVFNPEYTLGRVNKNLQSNTVLYELDGDSQSNKKSGLVYKYETAQKALTIDLSNMSRVCYSCGNKGVRFRTV